MPSLRAFLCVVIIVLFAGCGQEKSYRLVSSKYNFSVEFPEHPTEETKTNDEGLPKTRWEVNHEKVVAKDYFAAQATSSKEILDPELELVPYWSLLAPDGISIIEHHRFKLKARETGREVDAMQMVTKENATGAMIRSIYIVDGHNLVIVSARMNENPGKAALYLDSLTVLR